MSDDRMVGIDIGTTSVKVVAFTLGGVGKRTYNAPHETGRPRPGWAAQDPKHWVKATEDGLAHVSQDDVTVRSVGIVSQVNTHVFVDKSLEPLAPAIVWQDQRCAAIAAEMDQRFSTADKHRIWGSPITLDASFLPARAEWLAREHPDLWARTRWVLSPKDFVAARMTGRVATDLLSSVRIANADGYIPEAVALADGLADKLPPILPIQARMVGTMDAFGAVIGTGLPWAGRQGMLVCGTSLVVAGASAAPGSAPGIVTFPRYEGVSVHAGPTQAAGDAVRWWCGVSGLDPRSVFRAAESGRSGLVFTPHLMGERAPLWDSTARGTFLGLRSDTTRADMSRAVLEGVAMSGRQVLEAVEQACGFTLESMTLSGGGGYDPTWSQIFADVLGRPVEQLRQLESGALGAALLGAVEAGIYPSLASAASATVKVNNVYTPSRSTDELYSVYRDSYQALREIQARLV